MGVIEGFQVRGYFATGDTLFRHDVADILPVLGHAILTDAGWHDGHRSTEPVAVATCMIASGSFVQVWQDGGVRLFLLDTRVGDVLVDRPPPRDHLLAEALARETAAIGRGYVPDRHTDFDVEHGWRVKMEMGRGG